MEKDKKHFWNKIKKHITYHVTVILFGLTMALSFAIVDKVLAQTTITLKHKQLTDVEIVVYLILVFLFILSAYTLILGIIKKTYSISHWYQLKCFLQEGWGQFKHFLRNNAIIFALVLLYVFFYHFWESWIGNHIIDPFLCHFESNLLNDSIFFIISIVCLVLYFIEIFARKKRIKLQTLVVSIIAIAFWVYYRFHLGLCGMNDSPYYLYLKPLSINNSIKYFDIVLVIATCEYCSYFWLKMKDLKVSGMKFNPNQGLTRNLPIDNTQHDLLERDKIAESVVGKLLVTNTSKGSFTYGIDAPWGSGKTSFINLMKNHLKTDKKRKIVIDFNPWLYATKKDLVTAFFDELSKTLKLFDTSLAESLIDYSKLLSAFGTAETKMISSLLELAQNNSPLQEKKQQISNAIKAIRRRIIVFIDDLDRLEADEILEMMKLIRNVSDFPYMYIIAAYDKTYVVKCLSTKMKSSATNFIEKIFEHEDILAPCSNESLRRALADEIKRKSEKTDLTDYIINHENKPLNALSNLREVYRLSNRFSSTYDLTNGEIDDIELLLFELFKTKYPVAFSLFEHKWHEILVPDDQHQNYLIFQGEDQDGFFNFIKYLERNKLDMCLNEFDIKTIEMILSNLFEPNDEDNDREYRIKSTKWFSRYMNLTQLKSDIPEKEFIKALEKSIEEIKTQIDEWSIDKSVSLRHRLFNYDKDEKCDREQLIKNIQGLLYASIKNNWSITDELTEIISHLNRFNKKEDFTDENRTVIMDQLKNNGYSDFLINYVAYLYKEKNWAKISLREEDLIDVQRSVFEKCCKTYQNNMPSVLSCFATLLGKESYIIKASDKVFKYHDKYIDSLVSAMQTHARTHSGDFLRVMIDTKIKHPDSRYKIHAIENSFYLESKIAINPITKLIWGSWEKNKAFLLKLAPDEDLTDAEIKRYIALFKQFEKNHYKPVLLFKPYGRIKYYRDKFIIYMLK